MQAISRRITEVFTMTEQCASILTSRVQIVKKFQMQEIRREKVTQEWRNYTWEVDEKSSVISRGNFHCQNHQKNELSI